MCCKERESLTLSAALYSRRSVLHPSTIWRRDICLVRAKVGPSIPLSFAFDDVVFLQGFLSVPWCKGEARGGRGMKGFPLNDIHKHIENRIQIRKKIYYLHNTKFSGIKCNILIHWNFAFSENDSADYLCSKDNDNRRLIMSSWFCREFLTNRHN